jgi:hypothetical protein
MRSGLVALLACCLLLAGCSTLTGSGAGDGRFDDTVTPVPVSDPDRESSLPPGLTDEGIGSISVLVRNHRDALENRSYVMTEWERSRSIRPDRPDILVTRSEQMRVESATVYSHRLSRVRATPSGSREFIRATYADGDQWHQRTVNGTSESFAGGPLRSDRDRFAFAATFAMEQYLSVGTASVVPLSENGSTIYRVRNERPGRFNDHWSNYSAVAYVEPSGFVRRLSVSYVVDHGDVREVVAYRFAYERRGNVSTAPPDWLERADRAAESE